MKNVVVTEGESDLLLLKALLNGSGENTEIVKAGGWSGADSLARSYLVNGHHNVALVVDADTYDPRAADERRRFLNHSLESVALRTQWRVFVIVPEIEGLLFQDSRVLTEIIGHPVSEEDFRVGQLAPKQTFARLVPSRTRAQLFQERLGDVDLTPLHSHPEVLQLRQFLMGARKKVAA